MWKFCDSAADISLTKTCIIDLLTLFRYSFLYINYCRDSTPYLIRVPVITPYLKSFNDNIPTF